MQIIFHAFMWRYKDITNQLLEIKQQGFTAVQISPCQGIKGDWNDFVWWKLYQPIDMRIVNSPLGTKDDIKELCDKANELGINIIADVILRHAAGLDNGEPFFHQDVNRDLHRYLNCTQRNCDDYNDRYKYTHLATGMPMFNYEDKDFQQICKNFLYELKNVGIKGFRLDQLKHFPVEREGSTFLKNVFSDFKDMILYGEVLNCPTHINDLYVPYMKVCGEGYTSDMRNYVKFFDSHDIYYTFNISKQYNDEMRIQKWRDLLNNNSISDVIYFPHPFETLWKTNEIREINFKFNKR